WRCLAVAQQLAGVLALAVGATEVLAETTGLELHVAAALVALDHRTVITLDLELALLHLEAAAVGVVATYMQLALLVHQVAVHGSRAHRATALGTQHPGLAFLVIGSHLVARHQIDRCLAALLW